MAGYAGQMQFEKAEIIRKKIEHVENYQEKSVIVSRHLGNVDVFSVLKEGDIAYVNYLMIQNGTIVQTHTIELQTHLEEDDAEVLSFAIAQLRQTFNSTSPEIIVPLEIDYPEPGVLITIPKSG